MKYLWLEFAGEDGFGAGFGGKLERKIKKKGTSVYLKAMNWLFFNILPKTKKEKEKKFKRTEFHKCKK